MLSLSSIKQMTLSLLYLFQRKKNGKHTLLTVGLSRYTSTSPPLCASCFPGTLAIKYSAAFWLCPSFVQSGLQPSTSKTPFWSYHVHVKPYANWVSTVFVLVWHTENLSQKTYSRKQHSSNEVVLLHTARTMYLLWILRTKFTMSTAHSR